MKKSLHKFLAASILLAFAFPLAALAQSVIFTQITPPDGAQFPRMSTYLRVQNAAGQFVYTLQTRNITVIEDGMYLGAADLTAQTVGALFALSVSPGSTFDIHDAEGVSRYQYILDALTQWSHLPAASPPDDLSLFTPQGGHIRHTTSRSAWLGALTTTPFDFQQTEPDLTAIVQGLQAISDPTPRPGMGRALLWITAPLSTNEEITLGLQTLATQAIENHVHITIWLVASPSIAESPETARLMNLAAQTGGQLAIISTREDIPNLEGLLNDYRQAYRLEYLSRMSPGATHRFAAWIHAPGLDVTTPEIAYAFDIQTPNPIFVSLPAEILRAPPKGDRMAVLDPASYLPKQQSIEMMVEFSDQHPRQIVQTTLYIDGKAAIQNTAPPFEQFTWDISVYPASGSHTLRLEAIDALGLVGSSIEVPVQVRVAAPENRLQAQVVARTPTLIAAGVLLAATALLLFFLFGNPKKSKRYPKRISVKTAKRFQKVGQTPKSPQTRQEGLRLWANRFHWPQQPASPTQVRAYLVPLDESFQPSARSPIGITSPQVSIGSDSSKSSVAIQNNALAEIHAYLKLDEQGRFHLVETQTVAGTWLNFAPLNGEEKLLQHGDLIHFGNIGFRFEYNPPITHEPMVILLNKSKTP